MIRGRNIFLFDFAEDHILITGLHPATTYTIVVEARRMENYRVEGQYSYKLYIMGKCHIHVDDVFNIWSVALWFSKNTVALGLFWPSYCWSTNKKFHINWYSINIDEITVFSLIWLCLICWLSLFFQERKMTPPTNSYWPPSQKPWPWGPPDPLTHPVTCPLQPPHVMPCVWSGIPLSNMV